MVETVRNSRPNFKRIVATNASQFYVFARRDFSAMESLISFRIVAGQSDGVGDVVEFFAADFFELLSF